jgi:hypothetical protein
LAFNLLTDAMTVITRPETDEFVKGKRGLLSCESDLDLVVRFSSPRRLRWARAGSRCVRLASVGRHCDGDAAGKALINQTGRARNTTKIN